LLVMRDHRLEDLDVGGRVGRGRAILRRGAGRDWRRGAGF
jgi:hypothetical protein